MLTRDHGIAHYDYAAGRVDPDRLTTREHGHYVALADRMLTLYATGTGRTRRELHQDVRNIFAQEDDCPQRRIDAFCKLLDDASRWRKAGSVRPAELRRRVFRMAAARHPLVERADRLFESAESEVKQQIATELGREWFDIEADLFADIIEFHRLESFEGYDDGRSLLSRYNVAQVQVALYGAVSLDIRAGRDFETILRYARLCRLMHTIRARGNGRYDLRLDGPASVLRQTRRYGIGIAKFLPALLACSDWSCHAVVKTPRRGWAMSLDLTSEDGLKGHLPAPEEFDSSIEASFAEKWGSEPRDGWMLIREGDILVSGQKTFVPDFTFQHESGRRVLLEIVGFWTPEYLAARRETLDEFRDEPILLAIGPAAGQTEALTDLDFPGERMIPFKSALKLKDVLERLAVFA